MAELHHLLVDVLLPLFIIFFNYLFIGALRYPKEYGICNHPSCARCQGKKKFNKEVLLYRLEEYKNSNIDKDNLEPSRILLLQFLVSHSQTQSGYTRLCNSHDVREFHVLQKCSLDNKVCITGVS